MTREEAIKRLEDTFEGWNMWVMDNDSPASKMSKALGMAIAALREQEEGRKGCGWCKQFAGVPLRGFTEHGCQSITVKFCPMCGRRLEET